MAAASGTYQMQFALYDSANAGTQIGTVIENPAVSVINAVFFVQLDFGAGAFSGAERFLEISVRRNSNESYVVLAPRQRITSVPYTLRAQSAATAETDARLKLVGAQRWDLLTQTVEYDLTSPRGIAFDGEFIWVSTLAGTVKKLRTSDAAILGSYTVGADPRGMATDGTNLWVTNFGGNSVTKLRLSDGADMGTYAVGTNPVAVAFDGTNVWIVNSGSANVTKIRAGDGLTIGTYSVGTGPNSIVFDGTYIFVGSGAGITKRWASNGGFASTIGHSAGGIAYDGTHLWVSLRNGLDVLKLRPSDHSQVDYIYVGTSPGAVLFDGRNLWATAGGSVVRWNPNAYGAASGTTVFPGAQFNSSLAFDGTHVWVTKPSSSKLMKIPALP
jgi:hypothetical protein